MDPNQVMNNLRKVGDVLEIDTVKPGLKCLQALVSTGKGMADECDRLSDSFIPYQRSIFLICSVAYFFENQTSKETKF